MRLKTIIVSTQSYGGAGKAALRLHRALKGADIDNDMLVKDKRAADYDVLRAGDRIFFNESVDRFYSSDFNKTLIPGNTLFSIPYPNPEMSFLESFRQYDVVNLHWTAHFLSLEAICALNKPIVWTLHDQNAFTGGCHYTHGCERFKEKCDGCPQLLKDSFDLPRLVMEAKHKYLPKNIVVVTPSKWLADCARQSGLFRHSRIEVIPNSLDTDIYKPFSKDEAKRAFNLPEKGKVILLGSCDLSERRKGVSHFIQAFHKMAEKAEFASMLAENQLTILTFGNGSAILDEFAHIYRPMGDIEDEALLAKIYSAADVFVLPSEEDNLPNVMLESFACGTPVVSFKVGGMPDSIINGQTGFLAESFDVSDLSEKIKDAMFDESLPEKCRRYALEHFRPDIQAARYQRLFEDVLASYRGADMDLSAAPAIFPELSQFAADYSLKANIEQQEVIHNLQAQLSQQQAQYNALIGSTSWKLTKPLRALSRMLKK